MPGSTVDEGQGVADGRSAPARHILGRTRELAELRAAFDAARAAQGGLHFVAGPAGIGKTRLVQAFCSELSAGDGVALWGSAWDSGGAPPLWLWRQVVRDLAGQDVGRRVIESLPARRAALLSNLATHADDAADERQRTESDFQDRARFGLFELIEDLLRDAAREAPLLVVLDDVQAADNDSLLALRFLASALRTAPVLLLATERETVPGERAELRPLLAELARTSGRTTLAGLDRDALAELLLRRAPDIDRALIDEIHATTDGHPFFAEEIVQLLRAENRLTGARGGLPLPRSVRDAIEARLCMLSSDARSTLRIASAVGREFSFPLVAAVAADDGRTLATLDEAVAAGLAAEIAPGTFRFVHGLVREALYRDLSFSERTRTHRAIGEALEARHGDAPDHAQEIAHHFGQSAPTGELAARAIEHARRAGRVSAASLAYETAAELYELAVQLAELDGSLAERPELLIDLGAARARAGDTRARETLLAAATSARHLGRPDLLAQAAMSFRAFELSPGVVDDRQVKLIEEALAGIDPTDTPTRARLLARLAVALYYRVDSEELRRHLANEATELARGDGDPSLRAYVLANAQLATWGPDDTQLALGWTDELIELTEGRSDYGLALDARNRQVDFLLELGDLPGADHAIAALARIVAEHPNPRGRAMLALQRSRRALIEGDLETARRRNAEANELGRGLHDALIGMLAAAQQFGMLWRAGQLDRGEELTRAFAARAPGMPVWRAALAYVLVAQGKTELARRELDRIAAEGFDLFPRDNVWLLAMALLASVCAELGDAERAREVHDLLSPFADRIITSAHAMYAGPAARFLVRLAETTGDVADAERHRIAAVSAAKRMRDDLLAGELERALPAEPVDAPDAPADRGHLSREGEVWTFSLSDSTVRVRDAKGVRYLATLLESPGEDVYALDLVQPGSARSGRSDGSPGPALDAEAKAAYRERVQELRAEIDEAERWSDSERLTRARSELDLVAHELASAVGLGGRDRKTGSDAERARISVTRAVRSTIKRVAEHDEALGIELENTVRTGTFCSFQPDPRRPVAWTVDRG